MWKLKFNLKAYLSTAALPGQTTKTALTEEFMFQNVAYRPTVYITGTLVCTIYVLSHLQNTSFITKAQG